MRDSRAKTTSLTSVVRLVIPFRASWSQLYCGCAAQLPSLGSRQLPVGSADAATRPAFYSLAECWCRDRAPNLPMLYSRVGDMEFSSGLTQCEFAGGPVPPQLQPGITAHRSVMVTPITSGSRQKESSNQIPIDSVDEPTPWLLVFAYLGDRFRRENQRGMALEKIGSPMGVSKQNMLKLTKGRTVGLDVFWRIAEYLFDGSVDAMVAAAREWWTTLHPVEQGRYVAWSTGIADDRSKTKRGVTIRDSAQGRELERLQDLRPPAVPQRHSTRVPTAVTTVGNKSLSAKKQQKK
jgi:hypothetical protein